MMRFLLSSSSFWILLLFFNELEMITFSQIEVANAHSKRVGAIVLLED